MKCEWPAITRCCFCLPLRRGLIAIGYVKFIYSTLMIGFYSYVIHRGVETTALLLRGAADDVAAELCLFLYLLELVSCILMLYGAHMKVPYYLKICFYYGLMSTIAILLSEMVEFVIVPRMAIEMIGVFFAGFFIEIYLLTILWNVMEKMKAAGCQQITNPLQHFISAP